MKKAILALSSIETVWKRTAPCLAFLSLVLAGSVAAQRQEASALEGYLLPERVKSLEEMRAEAPPFSSLRMPTDYAISGVLQDAASASNATVGPRGPGARQPPCSPAFVFLRNAGNNPSVYRATRPVMGSSQKHTLFTGRFTFGLIRGYLGQANVTLPGGQVLLVNAGGHQVFKLGPFVGPNITVFASVPVDYTLCANTASAQAFLFGGSPSFLLTNAVDMILGDS